MELIIFQVLAWIAFAGIIVFIFIQWKYPENMNDNLDAIRKIWYSLFILGVLVYWTKHPDSLFTDWKSYLIVAVSFVLIDTFILLGLMVNKFGSAELTKSTKTIEKNQRLIEEDREKIENVLTILNVEGITGYYGSKANYIYGLDKVIQSYAVKRNFTFTILPFTTESEQELALTDFTHKKVIIATLKRKTAYYTNKDSVAIYPITVLGDSYIIILKDSDNLSESDSLCISLLLSAYDILAQNLQGGNPW